MIMIGDFSLHAPLWLLLLPFMWYLYFRYHWKAQRNVSLKFSSIQNLASIRPSWRIKLLPLLHILNLSALTLLIVALAQPRTNLAEEKVKAEGIDIMLAMDLSTSMLARDFHPSRLEVSKKVASEFVDKRKYDRIGLVVFSGESYTQCPVTSDHAIVKSFIEMQETGLLTDGTAIGMGVATAVSRLKDSDAKSKIIILLTDGVNNAGYIDPDIAIEMAVGSDIKIYTIGVGSEGVAMMPISRNLNGEFIYGPQQVNIDETLLTDIANRTGGKYFRATDVESLTKIYNTIDQLEKSEIETNVFRRYNERFKPFAWCAFALMLFSSILNKSILRTFP